MSMTLKEYYEQEVPRGKKKKFRQKLASSCYVTELHVYKWINSENVPPKLTQEKIAEVTGLSIDGLFSISGKNEA